MAVSFKVPKSPKRSIFNIDNFLGVDLTNTGANIEEVRSPNAENMVRYVPGKVRKRMGYQKDVIFGKDVNVNYAIGTSPVEKEIIVKADAVDTYIKVYDLLKRMVSKDGNPFNVYYEFDYMSEDDFYVGNTLVSASEEWTHSSYMVAKTASGYVEYIAVKSAVPQNIYIKNFSVMYGKDANYSWSPAPHYFVERTKDEPIYGVHICKTGTFEGNRVVNVNRALNTSSSFSSYSINNDWVDIGDMGEIPYPGRKVIVDFDYKLTGDDMNFAVGSSPILVPSTDGAIQHFRGEITTNTYLTTKYAVGNPSGTGTFEIRNCAILYEVGETYDWSAAPEDNGGEFAIADTFFVGSKNYAIMESYESQDSASGGTATVTVNIANAGSHVAGFAHISFDLHTSTYDVLNSLTVQLLNDQNQYVWTETYTENINSNHYDFYISAADEAYYVNRIVLNYTVATGYTVWTAVSNIKINTIKPRSSYDISPKKYIYHVGSDFYLRASNSSVFTKVYGAANQHISKSWQFNKRLYILDGKDIYSYEDGDESVYPINAENGYIPTVTISRGSNGGGVPYEPLNMLQPGFYETFLTASSTQVLYRLSFGNLDYTTIKAWVMDSNGIWQEQIEGTHFKVNRGSGEVIFNNSPGLPPLTGEDNVKILAYRTVPGYRERITKCTNGTVFGVGGAEDRLFLTGNPDYPNWDFYSEQYDPTYFPDTGYSALGSEQSAIVGYALVNNYLAAFKDGFDTSQSVFIREGDLIVNENTNMTEPAFKLINTLQGHGVIAPYAFGYLTQEPLFLTKSGIYAITAQDITGEKYSQNRSFYLNGKLTKEEHLENAVATVFNDMYILAVNDKLYILDGLQATRTDRSEPYSTRQYVAFYCKDVPALCMWTDNDALWFGTSNGKVCMFNTDVEDLDSYSDDGKAIYCCWETPDLDGKLFYKNKTFRYFAIRMMKALRTSVKLWSEKLGTWNFIKEDTASGVVFNFEDVDFTNFSFSTDSSEKVVHTKVRVKKVDKARFRVENGKLNEPFGLFDLALEYIESGNYKG